VSKYLKTRFKKEKIYLMAHSGGTFSGIQAVAKAPELFEAYLAVAQITNQLESEQAAYKFMLEEYQKRNDRKMLRKFKKYSIDDINSPSYKVFRDKPMHQLGIGTTREMKSVVKGIFVPVMTNSDYTFREKVNIWRGKHYTSKVAGLWNKLVYINLLEKINQIKIPIYFFHGVYDYTVSYPLAYQFFEALESPHKAFYTFDQSAHSPFLEEPEKFEKIIINDVIKNQ
jgi:pimeloyl-ACP methyl ester carboxylesterase